MCEFDNYNWVWKLVEDSKNTVLGESWFNETLEGMHKDVLMSGKYNACDMLAYIEESGNNIVILRYGSGYLIVDFRGCDVAVLSDWGIRQESKIRNLKVKSRFDKNARGVIPLAMFFKKSGDDMLVSSLVITYRNDLALRVYRLDSQGKDFSYRDMEICPYVNGMKIVVSGIKSGYVGHKFCENREEPFDCYLRVESNGLSRGYNIEFGSDLEILSVA